MKISAVTLALWSLAGCLEANTAPPALPERVSTLCESGIGFFDDSSAIDKPERDSAIRACKTAVRNAVDRAPAAACPRIKVLTACEAAQRVGRACSPSSDLFLVVEY
jgi:hypothetical protein